MTSSSNMAPTRQVPPPPPVNLLDNTNMNQQQNGSYCFASDDVSTANQKTPKRRIPAEYDWIVPNVANKSRLNKN